MVRHLQCPLSGAHLNQKQRDFIKSVNQARMTPESVFGDVKNYFKRMDFKKNLKVGLSCVSKMHRGSVILTNASIKMMFFSFDPPLLEDYIQ